jgi:hypothetical protein
MYAYIDAHRERFGVEPICRVLQVAPSGYRRHAAQFRSPELRPARAKRNEQLMVESVALIPRSRVNNRRPCRSLARPSTEWLPSLRRQGGGDATESRVGAG